MTGGASNAATFAAMLGRRTSQRRDEDEIQTSVVELLHGQSADHAVPSALVKLQELASAHVGSIDMQVVAGTVREAIKEVQSSAKVIEGETLAIDAEAPPVNDETHESDNGHRG